MTQARDARKKRSAYPVLKQAFDFLFAAILSAILLLPMGILAAVICLESEGAPIFPQERLGLNGKAFIMYKFRTMRKGAEADGPRLAEENDLRCTRLGRFLRKYRIDELPQLWNIFRGDMSFVGPRPERPCFYPEIERTVPNFRSRLAVKPGLTGHAQVSGGYDLPAQEKLAYDLDYIARQSVWLDLKCLILTVPVVLFGRGAR